MSSSISAVDGDPVPEPSNDHNIWVRDPKLAVENGRLVLRHRFQKQILDLKHDGETMKIGCTTVTKEAVRDIASVFGLGPIY